MHNHLNEFTRETLQKNMCLNSIVTTKLLKGKKKRHNKKTPKQLGADEIFDINAGVATG